MTANLQTLIEQLALGEATQQAEAAEALSRMGAEAQPAAAVLVRAVGSGDDAVCEWCVAALEDLGPPPAGQIQELVGLARGGSQDVAYWAITLLGRAGDDAASAVAALAGIVSDSSELPLRERAAWALGKIGPPAAAARPVLREAAAGKEARLARLASTALEALGE